MGLMRKVLFLLFFFLFFVFPLNAETNEKKEYGKYDFYSKCLDDALPKKMNNALVWKCSTKASKKLDSLNEQLLKIKTKRKRKKYAKSVQKFLEERIY